MDSVPISLLHEDWTRILGEITPEPDSPATALVISIGPQWGSVTAGTIADEIADERYFESRDYYPYVQEFDLSHDRLFEAANDDIQLLSRSGDPIPHDEGDDAFNETIISVFREWTLEFLGKRDHHLIWLWLGDHDRSLWKPTRLTSRRRTSPIPSRVD